MDNTENVNTTPVNNTTDNNTDTQDVQPNTVEQPTPEVVTPDVQPTTEVPITQPTPEVQVTPEVTQEEPAKPVEESKPTVALEGESDEELLEDVDNANTVTIDGPTFVSEMFSQNPGEISKFLNMTQKELKKEQNKMKRKGFAMDNKYANLFLLQSIRDECGILVMGCLASWLLTRLGCSIYWTLFVMVASIMAYITYNNRKKLKYYNKERKAYNQKTKLNPENPETLNWLNYLLQKAWPTAEPIIGNIVLENVNGILDQFNVGFDIKITEFSLGTEAPKLMEMCPTTDSDPNVIRFTCLAKYEPLDTSKISKYEIESGEKRASNIVLAIKKGPLSIPTQVTDVLFIGKLLFVITTMQTFPYIKKVEFTFVEQPNIKWDLKPLKSGVDLMAVIPGLNAGIDEIVKMIISSIALEPTRITIDVEDLLNSMTLDQPIGLLKLNFYEGKDLKNTSKLGTDDPYARFTVNGNTLSQTKVIDNDLNPSWNHVEYVIVSGLIYSDPINNSDLALIEVMSENAMKKNSVMGRSENLYLRQYIALCEYLRKKKLDAEREAAFNDNLTREGITDPKDIKRLRKEEIKKRKNELAVREKNKNFAQKLLDSLEQSAVDYINGLTEVEKKEYMNRWGNPLLDTDTIIPLYQVGKDNKIDLTKSAGSIRMGINYIPLNQFNDNIGSQDESEMFSETGIARIWIYKIQKLEKNPNPYCVADIDGVEVVTTPVRKINNNPGYNTFKDVFIKNFSTAKLTITVKNQETGSDSTLGTFSWGVYDIYERIKEDPQANWFKLASKFEEAVINIGIEWKPMIMDMTTTLQKPIGVCRLHVKGAKDLKSLDTFGASDPYVRVYLSGKEVGVTDIVEKDINPEWNEVYYLMIRSKNDRLSFDVFDYEEMKSDRKLGKVEMNVTDVCRNIIINGEQALLSKAWENMNPLPEVKMTQHDNVGVSVPLFDHQQRNLASKGRVEFNIKFYDIADLGLPIEEVDKEKEQDEEKTQDILASTNTDRTFIDKLQASNLLSGILNVKIYDVKEVPKPCIFNVDVYFEDEPEHTLLSTQKTVKVGTEGNIEEIAEGFVRNYTRTKVIFAVNEKNGTNTNVLTTYAIPVEQLLVGKLGLKTPFVHICENGTTKIKLGVQYQPLNMNLERGELCPEMGILDIRIDQANVIPADKSGTSDPYVKVILRGEEIYKTGTIKKTLNPVWNEKFSIPIAERIHNKLIFQIYDWNKVQKHDLIGQAEVPLHEVYDGEILNVKLPLYQIVKNHEKVESGDLSLNIEFKPTVHNTRMRNRFGNNSRTALKLAGGVAGGVGNVVGGVAGGVGNVVGGVAGGVAGGVGSIVGGVSRGIKKVSGHSNKDNSGSSLKIKIISAEGLKAVDNSGTSDPYVKVQHQKKTLHKTKVIKKNLNPVWNEECTIPFDRETSDPIISFIIKDSNKFGKSVDIGNVEFNINSILFSTGQISVNQTFDVQNGPGKLNLQIEYAEGVSTTAAPVAESP
ncbi:hypothetical protein BCR32DRAFT_246911 [Anaeromyces robustus]|jgi:Ca2+-dependent lipid-binding protein|uniref:Tricalbin n=1 Tax=Anaeromyces robustus TaxID=1754192 RepID=A0A1Y1WZH5_9FUNG|nr:hypothetical protein BCR32DRAFT_246911 [Anaeromyces robustus]|eukprot:ORX78795.1 hypothetical protein BCR32DRAFT_246911 [Anaeromyces robustus]